MSESNEAVANTNLPGTSKNNSESQRKSYIMHRQRHRDTFIDYIEVIDHCHLTRSEGVDVKARKKLIIVSGLCVFFMICEVIGGVLSNSLAIVTDASHLLTDFTSFMISLFAIWIAGRPSTQKMSFGWYRAEVIGAMLSVILIWVTTVILVTLAVERLMNPDFAVDSTIMLITSGLAILVNLIMGLQLQHGHSHRDWSDTHPHSQVVVKKVARRSQECKKPSRSADGIDDGLSLSTASNAKLTCESAPCGDDSCKQHTSETGELESVDDASDSDAISDENSPSTREVQAETAAVVDEAEPGVQHHGGNAFHRAMNMNVRAAFVHVIGHLIHSVGVFLAAVFIYFRPDWVIADPICTFIFSAIVLLTTFYILKDALTVLMEGAPGNLYYEEVRDIFMNVEGVQGVHDLRIWALSVNKFALSVHLAVDHRTDRRRVLKEANAAIRKRCNFFETTIQIEQFTPQMKSCTRCSHPDV